MIFGLFENKQARAFREETANTLADADSLEKKDKKKIAKFVLLKIIEYKPIYDIETGVKDFVSWANNKIK